jgi:hypothetical protein
MAFKRWGCNFDGPWPNTDILKQRPGVWVIWRRTGDHWKVIDVGESSNVRASVERRAAELAAGIEGEATIHYSATYTPKLAGEARRELACHIERIARPQE